MMCQHKLHLDKVPVQREEGEKLSLQFLTQGASTPRHGAVIEGNVYMPASPFEPRWRKVNVW